MPSLFSRRSQAPRIVRRFIRRSVDPIPITPLGVFVLVGSFAVLWTEAFPSMDLVLLIVGYGGLAFVALSMVLVIGVALALRFRAPGPIEPLTAETGKPLATGHRLPWLGWLPLVSVRSEWDEPEAAVRSATDGLRRREEIVELAARGEVRRIVRRTVVSDVLGLARIAFHRSQEVHIDVLPHAGGLSRMAQLEAFAGGDDRPHPMGLDVGDRVEIRRYVAGDPARFIHWKVFGRTRKLMVRVPERALSKADRTAAFFVAGQDDEASAAVARVALESGSLGVDWVFGTDLESQGVDRIEPAISVLLRSIDARAHHGAALGTFVEKVERSGPAAVVVFAPPHHGPWVERVRELARRRPHGLRVVIGLDALRSKPRISLLRRIFVAELPHRAVDPKELEAIARDLATTRAEVIVFERASGRRLSPSRAVEVAGRRAA
jgi:hypothetical protein